MIVIKRQPARKVGPLQTLLIQARPHFDQPNYDSDARLRFLRAMECKTPALGSRLYASNDEEAEFYNTCKSPACSSCGHWATIRWQRDRWLALPEGPYRVVTFTMPNTLWPLFVSNQRLARKLAEIAARVIIGYARVVRGMEVGVMPILHTFNGKLEYNCHIHALVTGWDLRKNADSSVYLDPVQLMRSWKRVVIALLRSALLGGHLKSSLTNEDLESLLQHEAIRDWILKVQSVGGKKHFLRYAGLSKKANKRRTLV